MQVNTGDENQVTRRKSKAKLKQERAEEELRNLLALPEFRYYIWTILKDKARIHGGISTPDAVLMAIQNGERNVGLSILSDIMALGEHYYGVITEEGLKRDNE